MTFWAQILNISSAIACVTRIHQEIGIFLLFLLILIYTSEMPLTSWHIHGHSTDACVHHQLIAAVLWVLSKWYVWIPIISWKRAIKGQAWKLLLVIPVILLLVRYFYRLFPNERSWIRHRHTETPMVFIFMNLFGVPFKHTSSPIHQKIIIGGSKRGRQGRAPQGSKFFHFDAVFGKK